MRIVWDGWLHDTLQAGVYKSDEQAYAVQPDPAMPQQEPQAQLGPAVGRAHGRPPAPTEPPATMPRACPATAFSAGGSRGAALQRGVMQAATAAGPAAPHPPSRIQVEPARSVSEAQEPKRCKYAKIWLLSGVVICARRHSQKDGIHRDAILPMQGNDRQFQAEAGCIACTTQQ